jgi:serine phosphatase RsbU (regulator of sigma subunit)
MLIRRGNGKIEHLSSTGPPLGLLEGADFSHRPFRLHPGDLILLYTDGVIEAVDESGDQLGVGWLEEQLRSSGPSVGDTTRSIYDALSQSTDRSATEDDLTFLAASLAV